MALGSRFELFTLHMVLYTLNHCHAKNKSFIAQNESRGLATEVSLWRKQPSSSQPKINLCLKGSTREVSSLPLHSFPMEFATWSDNHRSEILHMYTYTQVYDTSWKMFNFAIVSLMLSFTPSGKDFHRSLFFVTPSLPRVTKHNQDFWARFKLLPVRKFLWKKKYIYENIQN